MSIDLYVYLHYMYYQMWGIACCLQPRMVSNRLWVENSKVMPSVSSLGSKSRQYGLSLRESKQRIETENPASASLHADRIIFPI